MTVMTLGRYEYRSVETPTGWYARYGLVGCSFYEELTTYEFNTEQEALTAAGRRCAHYTRFPADYHS